MDQSTNRFGFSTASRLPAPRENRTFRDGSAPSMLRGRVLPGRTPQINPVHVNPLDAPHARASQSVPANNVNKDIIREDIDRGKAHYPAKARTLPRRPRPSLSDRTKETLSQIPPSPSPRRRVSGFFPSESPAPSARPVSSLGRSRPGTSHGQHAPLPSGFPTPRPQSPIKRALVPVTGNQTPITYPSKRAVTSSLPPGKAVSKDKASTPSRSGPINPENAGLVRKPGKSGASLFKDSKTLAARPCQPRPSAQDVFANPPARANMPSRPRAAESDASTNAYSKASKTAAKASADSPSSPKVQGIPASSAALRETIAKAKAARRDIAKLENKELARPIPKANGFPDHDVGGFDEDILRDRVATARTNGRLNIAALGLTEVPREVLNMYTSNIGGGAWYESVDLVRLIAADNDFEHFDDAIFPDNAMDTLDEDDASKEHLFGGLETLDLHNNHLKSVPMGLRRLERLTTLNLSKNNLGNESLETISQIVSLRELRLGENTLSGTLSSQLCNLSNLEILDLHDNALNTISGDLQDMSSLRVLNIAGNKLASLPFECLASLPLVELDVARNRLSGSLFPPNVDGLPYLRSLNVANNALVSLTNDRLVHLPSLQDLNVTENRLKTLPDASCWRQLVTLAAGGNKMTSFPEGTTSLQHLKVVDFSMNDLRTVDVRVGLMESLTVLRVANNPLKERKFLNMDTGEMKRDLRSRIQTIDASDDQEDGIIGYDGSGPANTASPLGSWPVKAGNLDRSSTKLETIEPSEFKSLTESNEIKTLILHHNLLPHIPPAIIFANQTLTTLDISNNKLASAKYLFTELALPNLKSLDASSNAIASLGPLMEYLEAPKLIEIQVARNRLTILPPLRNNFPSLTTVYASDNKISRLPVESVQGLHVLDVRGNDINHLEPRLGLLEAEGLRTLVLGANTFKVPRRDVVDKGTGAVLAWLRSRIPEEEMRLG